MSHISVSMNHLLALNRLDYNSCTVVSSAQFSVGQFYWINYFILRITEHWDWTSQRL